MKDYFSQHAKVYAAFRPSYPQELYDFVFRFVSERNRAWDCATGNGQVAQVLASHFEEVCATDISQAQLENAVIKPNIKYSIASAEQTTFPDRTFDLITVGQAMHWFNIPSFYQEVDRVLKNGGVLAVWGYAILKINPAIDELFLGFYENTVGPYWDEARRLVETEYSSLPFPYKEVSSPKFNIVVEWNLEQFAGYLTSWSATQKYIRTHHVNPVDDLVKQLHPHWRRNENKTVSFPVFLRLGIKP